MLLSLSNSESKTFFEIINSELKCVINEYDSDTGRRPGKKRMEDGKYAKSIMEKWEITQDEIQNTNFINLDKIKNCKLDLTKEESIYSKKLLDKCIKEFEKELSNFQKPYFGITQVFADTKNDIENILKSYD